VRNARRIAELESRVEGLEWLLAETLDRNAPESSVLAPDAARKVAEERYGTPPPRRDKGPHS
jgi:hypothetical protein